MNWKECAQLMEGYSPGWRLTWPEHGFNEFDCNADFTASDVWGGISWLWTYPGDYLLSQEPFRTFFEVEGVTAIGLTGSTVIGWALLVLLFAVWGGVESRFF